MSGAGKGFMITLGLWVALVGTSSLLEVARGEAPFAMLHWDVGGKFVLATFLFVLALGTGVGIASDRIRARNGR